MSDFVFLLRSQEDDYQAAMGTPERAQNSLRAFAPSFAATDWSRVIALYDRLMSVAPSPVVALSRAIAVAERDGPAAGLAALAAISDVERLSAYPFYPAALGEFELRLGHYAAAQRHFSTALALSRNDTERRFLEKRRATASH